MIIHTAYKVKLHTGMKESALFNTTVAVYRSAVDYLIGVCLDHWGELAVTDGPNNQQRLIDRLVHATKDNPSPEYADFDTLFPMLPSYYRRSAITAAIGKVCSYKSNLQNWNNNPAGKEPSAPHAGFTHPVLYRGNMIQETGDYTYEIKVFRHGTWEWIPVSVRKSDRDYIRRHCSSRKECAPTLLKRGKEWFLVFPFEEKAALSKTSIYDRVIVAVDLGINTAAAVSVMRADGTILGRHFIRLTEETDRLWHAVNRIKKSQRLGGRKNTKLWAKAKGLNHELAVKTAEGIMDIAVLYNADVIVFEHLDRNGKVRGSKKQKLKLWRSQEVQAIVTNKAHRNGMRVSRVCARGTSRYAYDGSGIVERGINGNYSLCRFHTDKIYNCDLSASYNIGARYFVREICKSLDESSRLRVEANVPACAKRSTCTLSTLISLCAELAPSSAQAA